MNSKGVVELPVMAIFTIVAGSLIVLFFIVLTQHQSEGAKGETEARSLNFLDTLIKTAATARDTQNNITIVDETLLFICDETGLRFGFTSDRGLPLADLVVFAPSKLEGGLVNAYGVGSDVPYRAFNILYLTTPKFVIQNTTNLFSPPRTFTTVTIPDGSIGDKGRRIVISASQNSGVYTTAQRPKDLVVINPANPTARYGEVTYVSATRSTTVVYPSIEMLHGALLSRDAQTYNCVLNAYLQNLKFVNTIQRTRTAKLKDEAELADSTCYELYQLAPFDVIAQLPAAENFTVHDAFLFDEALKELTFTNNNVVRGDNCASIY